MRSRHGYDDGTNRDRPGTAERSHTGDMSRASLARSSRPVRQESGKRRRWPVVALISALAIGASLLFPVGRHQWALSLFRQPTHYTALFFNKILALPTTTARNEAMTVSFTIGNHEGRAVNYRYVLTDSYGKHSQILGQSTKTVASGATWTVWRVVRPKCITSPCRIVVSLPGYPETVDFRVAVGARPNSFVRLPSWAIGPFQRYQGNPLLTPPITPTAASRWEWPEVFNPAVVVVNGVFHMLYRGADSGNSSSIGAATSTDGHQFTPPLKNPVIAAVLPSEKHGVEDPRLYYVGGKYYTFFTGYNGITSNINEAVSRDALHWAQLGPVLDNTKDAAVVTDPEGRPVKIGGHYLMYYGQVGGTYLAWSTNLVHWTTIGHVDPGFPASYKPYEFCVAVTNYQTHAHGTVNHDIDLFVAGTLMARGRWHYAISEIMFSRSNLRTYAAQLKMPVLYPQTPYEKYGFTANTVFMNSIFFYKNSWWMYYGAGDSVIALANAALRQNGG